MIKIWERYFLVEMLKSFFFFLLVFYGLYVLIDYSSHASGLYNHSHFKIYEIVIYYLCQFVERMGVLIPFGLLLATIRTLTNLNMHNELIALMASGIKVKTLIRPFVAVGLAMVAIMYITTQFWMPSALQRINHIDQKHRSQKIKSNQIPAVQNLVLKDKTQLIYQNFDSLEKKLIDTYWIRDINDIYRIQYLYPYHEIPTGQGVDHFQRQPNGELTIVSSSSQEYFPEMRFKKHDLFQGMTDPEDESLTELWKKMPQKNETTSEKKSQIVSVFYHKMIMPWLCLLAVIGPAPFCVRYSRQIPLFFIYALSLFGLVVVYLVLNATLVLGKRQVADPLIIIIPFLAFASFFSYKYFKI